MKRSIEGQKTDYMKRVRIVIVISFCFSLHTLAKDIPVQSPGNHNDIQPGIQAAVDKAENGDRIVLPEGEFLFNKQVVVEKFISIKGAGLKKTILYRSPDMPDSLMHGREWNTMLFFNIRSDQSSRIVISGICFRSKKPSVVMGDGGSRIGDAGIRMVQCVDFLIEQCRFEYFGHGGIYVIHKDTLARGLIRKNEFYYNARFGLGYGVVIYSTNKQWIPDPQFGSSNFIFIEDNLFDYHRHTVASGGCGLFVFRYNTVLNNTAAYGEHAIDTHEARPLEGDNSPHGTRAVEVYNNVLINTKYTYGGNIKKGVRIGMSSLENAAVAIRAGEAVVYNNEVKGYRYAVRLSNWYFGGTPQPYPVLFGPGYLSGKALGPGHRGMNPPQSDGDVFIWDNKISPFLEDEWNTFPPFNNEEPGWWKEGRDYHLAPKPGYKPFPYPYPWKNDR